MPNYKSFDRVKGIDIFDVIGRVYNHECRNKSYNYRGTWAHVYRNNPDPNVNVYDVYEAYIEKGDNLTKSEAWAVVSYDKPKNHWRVSVVNPALSVTEFYHPAIGKTKEIAYEQVWKSLGVPSPVIKK